MQRGHMAFSFKTGAPTSLLSSLVLGTVFDDYLRKPCAFQQ